MAKEFEVKNIILNWDFIPAILITAFLCYFYLPYLSQSGENLSIILTLVGSNAGLMGIVLAGFSIFVAFMDKEFLPKLREAGLYSETIFMFTYSAILISIALISSILFSFVLYINFNAAIITFVFTIFFTFYGLLSVVLLFIQVKNISIAKGRYVAGEEGKLTREDF